jgi:6,7-dimethyl-8-ribityllumazine synthase|tara:strand:+ start:586 stop:999 length:414 start_codon:yes stop_codon:yes gene_type:complete
MSKKYKFLIVASSFYPKITDGLLNGAVTELKKRNLNFEVFKVNGSLEIPVQVSILLKKKKYDAVIAIGCIIKGKTDHYEFIGNAITNSLLSISVDKRIPISNTILTCKNIKQANERSSAKLNRAREAVLAALSVLNN